MKKKLLLSCLCALFLTTALWAQTDASELDNLLTQDEQSQKEYVRNAFKSPRVINGHSMEMLGKGVLDFRILHRFGSIDGGVNQLVGLDQASMRLGFDYGVGRNLTIGIGRSTLNKEIDGFVKYRIIQQSKGHNSFPMSILWVSGMTLNTTEISDPLVNHIENRIAYYHQAIIGRKFGTAYTLQLSPILIHRNMVDRNSDKNNMVALGIGGRMKLSNRTAFLLDTYPILYGARKNYNQMVLSVGFDIETGGHVFQLHITNAHGMNEKAFVAETTQKWSDLQIQFGFNLSRVFTIVKNKASSF